MFAAALFLITVMLAGMIASIFSEKVSEKFKEVYVVEGMFAISILFLFSAMISIDDFRPYAKEEAKRAEAAAFCQTTVETAASEYLADFGIDALTAATADDKIVENLAKRYEVDGKKYGPYLADKQVIEQCSAHNYIVQPMTAKTVRFTIADEK